MIDPSSYPPGTGPPERRYACVDCGQTLGPFEVYQMVVYPPGGMPDVVHPLCRVDYEARLKARSS